MLELNTLTESSITYFWGAWIHSRDGLAYIYKPNFFTVYNAVPLTKEVL